jgi:hypothetical protein
MIRASLSATANRRIDCLPIHDCPTFEDWSAHIHQRVATVVASSDQIAILSTHPRGTEFFSQYFPYWTYIEKTRQPGLTGHRYPSRLLSGGTGAELPRSGPSRDAGLFKAI